MGAGSEYAQSYSSFSGSDIVASFNRKVFAELQGLTYSVSREKVPIYTMGSPEPRSFSRGKRGIAGTVIFSVFDRDALLDAFKDQMKDKKTLGIQKFKMNDYDYVKTHTGSTTGFTSIDEWDQQMSNLGNGGTSPTQKTSDLVQMSVPHYADEILPFDITLTFANEYGNKACMVIYGVEFLNEGSGFSTDTVVTEKAYTYVARRIEPLRSLKGEESIDFAASW